MSVEPEAKSFAMDEPSRWLSKWSHVVAMFVFCCSYYPFDGHPWRWPVAVAASYTAFAFAIALGIGLDTADDFFGDPEVVKYVAKLLLPHSLILVVVTYAAYWWLHLVPVLPTWATEGRKLSLWDLAGIVIVWFSGTREGLWMGAKIKRYAAERANA